MDWTEKIDYESHPQSDFGGVDVEPPPEVYIHTFGRR